MLRNTGSADSRLSEQPTLPLDVDSLVAVAAVACLGAEQGGGVAAFRDLYLILTNLVKNPMEEKFKSVPLSVLKEKGLPRACWQLLEGLGFEEESDADRFKIKSGLRNEHYAAQKAVQAQLQEYEMNKSTSLVGGVQDGSGSHGADENVPGGSGTPQPSQVAEPPAIVEQLLQMGFTKYTIERVMSECQGVPDIEEFLSKLTHEDKGSSPAQWQCAICFNEYKERDPIWQCPAAHRYCVVCMRQHADADPFPRCPESGCGYLLTEEDLISLEVSRSRLEAFTEANVLKYIEEPQLRAPQVTWECQICFGEQDESSGWQCRFEHRFCRDCMQQHVDAVSADPFPRCPHPRCKHELTEDDLEIIGVSASRFEAIATAKLATAVDTLAGQGEVLVRCTTQTCGNAVVFPEGRNSRFECRVCNTAPFCTRCRQAPYHYKADCESVQPLRERWLQWIGGGREEYSGLRHQANETDKRHQALLDGIARHNELQADESWKAANCRLCPNCQRPVQKIDGCDSMRCGENYHGGEKQQGCGREFQWGAAKRYQAHIERRELPDLSSERIMCRGQRVFHPFGKCAFCDAGSSEGIHGLLFRCIHCKEFEVCAGCEPMLADLHEADHVFEILFESDFRCERLPEGTKVCVAKSPDGSLPVSRSCHGQLASEDLLGQCGVVTRTRRGPIEDITVELDNGAGTAVLPSAFLAPLVQSRREAQELVAKMVDGHGCAPSLAQASMPTRARNIIGKLEAYWSS